MKQYISKQLQESSRLKKDCLNLADDIEKAAKLIINSLKNGGKLLLCGNGGSAADAQHLATEFVNKFRQERKALPAIALTTDTSIITSVSNDSDYSNIFSRQIEALCNKGDALIVFTTSDISKTNKGHSANVKKAIISAKKRGATVIGLLSEKSKLAEKLVDLPIKVPSVDTPRIQEAHITIGHIVCDLAERSLCQ